jgi:ABC-type sugar transport system ATPase subunit
MPPLIPCVLSNVETQRAMTQEKGLVLDSNKVIETDNEKNSENRRSHRISIEHLVSDNQNLAVNEGGLISLLGYSECGLNILFNRLANIDTSISDSIFIKGTLVDCNKKITVGRSEMYFSSSPSQSDSKSVDSVPTRRFRYKISSTDQFS